MNRILRFSAIAAVAIALAMGMGVGLMGATAQEEANETDDSDGLAGSIEDIMDRNAPHNASESAVEIVDNWATDERLEQLGENDRDRLESWLDEARGDGDRDDQGETNPINPENCDRIIDTETCVTEWSYSDSTFTLTFHAVEETTVGLTEASDWDENSERIAYAEHDLEPGETTVTFTVFESQGAGVGFMTAAARQQGSGAVISIGQYAPDPFRHFGGTSGLFSGVAITVLLALLGAWIVVREESSGVVRASP
ncbi:hypothetical protein [Natronoglomus mannanivorans]|uniref:Uncharacterized protein n=1 Tax=Natronoglomus mannanivorans TaxID=2979990 RepID=A0AAP3E374_9EURY|nr:hypothetical protein [Halobacteria archaeon AArc-xg1-1]